MKTVQEYLASKDIDREILWDYYYNLQPIHLREELDDREIADKTVGDAFRDAKEAFLEYLNRLSKRKPIPAKGGKQGVFYAFRSMCESPCYHLEVELFYPDEGPDSPNYSMLTIEFSEAMGYYIADNPLTQLNIYSILAVILWGISFFGYSEEGEVEKRAYLKNLDDEEEFEEMTEKELDGLLNPDNSHSDPFFSKDLRAKAEETEEEKDLREQAEIAATKYYEASYKKERTEILRSWPAENVKMDQIPDRRESR